MSVYYFAVYSTHVELKISPKLADGDVDRDELATLPQDLDIGERPAASAATLHAADG